MEVSEIIKSQFHASLAMLKQAVEACPESLWASDDYPSPFWQIAFHALFYTHLYLQPSEADFRPWDKHQEGYRALSAGAESEEAGEPYSKDDILAYHRLCGDQVEEQVHRLDLEAESGFYWLPFSKLELQFYNIRHIQQHTGELYERLGAAGGPELRWVGMKSD